MNTLSLPVMDAAGGSAGGSPAGRLRHVALVGNPNAGKTTLFNALTGLRAKTSNFPGTTVERRLGSVALAAGRITLIDLPGMYALDAVTPEERVAREVLLGERDPDRRPEAIVLVLDATQLDRNLFLASQVLPLGLPTVAALTLCDAAEQAGITIDESRLREELGCEVVRVNARATGRKRAIAPLTEALDRLIKAPEAPRLTAALGGCGSCAGCPFSARFDWAESVGGACASRPREAHGRTTERIDAVLTRPRVGVLAFFAVMLTVFWTIFSLASHPMDLIDAGFALAGQAVASVLPAGGAWDDLQSLLVDGVIGGVGGMLIFLPQICILFFFLSLLEDSGYMARAAFVMDRLMQRVGLPGRAFVPLLSAHACAIPAVMAARVIPDRRDRLVTILIAPLMSCSARVPVYALIVSLLFADRPWLASLTFAGAYALGVIVALAMALVFKRTILRGETQPTVIELPNYRLPSLRNAVVSTYGRAKMFVKKAGTVILLLSVGLWFAATYPKAGENPAAAELARQAQVAENAGQPEAAELLAERAERAQEQANLDFSIAGRVGNLVEPVFAPLGFDERISIGVLTSLAAREVIVSTLAVLYGVGEAGSEDGSLRTALLDAKRDDGTAVFTVATCLSLLVFYVLAMQCLPTQAVTAKETGSWWWATLQFAYMSVLAYVFALVTYQVASALT